MIRSILAVAGGFAAMAVLVGVATASAARLMLPRAAPGTMPSPTPAYLTVNLIYSALFAVAGGYLAAFFAGRAPVAHALALAGLVFLMSIVSMKSSAGQQPRWYQLVLTAGMPLFVIGGGLIRSATVSR